MFEHWFRRFPVPASVCWKDPKWNYAQVPEDEERAGTVVGLFQFQLCSYYNLHSIEVTRREFFTLVPRLYSHVKYTLKLQNAFRRFSYLCECSSQGVVCLWSALDIEVPTIHLQIHSRVLRNNICPIINVILVIHSWSCTFAATCSGILCVKV